MYTTAFSARDQHVLSFSHWVQHVLSVFSKVHEFVQNSVFSPRSACFVIFTLGTPLFSVFSKVHEFVQNSVFSRRSARTVICALGAPLFQSSAHFYIFALGGPLFSDFQQRVSVCPKQRYQPEISTFAHFRTGRTTFKLFSAKCMTFQNSVISPRPARTVIFALGSPLFNSFQQSARVCHKNKTAFSARDQHVLSFSHWTSTFYTFQQSAQV